MPTPGQLWRHVVLGTLNSWLPGDPRGWRSRGHRKHSSGDYKRRPPEGEHDDIHRNSKRISGKPIVIPRPCRPVIGTKFIDKLAQYEQQLLCVSVGGMHVHLLVELPADLRETKRIIGQCKSAASHAVRDRLPGRVWGRDGGFDRVNDRAHQRNVYGYILKHAAEGAWVWSFREGVITPW